MTDLTRDTLYDANAERAVIGCILIEPTTIDVVAGILSPRDFHSEDCQVVYNAALSLHRRGLAIDPTTLQAELGSEWDKIGGYGFVSKCELVDSASHAESYARFVRGYTQKRKALDVCSHLSASALSDGGDGFAGELAIATLELGKMSKPISDVAQDNRFLIHWAAETLGPQPPTDWIVEPLFSAGSVSLIVGEGGVGKTFAALDACVAVAMSAGWVGFKTNGGLVLIVDEESGNRRMARRLAETLRGHDADGTTPVGYISLAGLDMGNDGDVAELRAAILGTGARFVVIDALADVMAGADENAVGDVQPIFHTLRMIAEEAQCAIVIIHHANRIGEYRGSSALKGAVDLMLIVTKDRDDHLTFKTEKARDIAPVTFGALMNWGSGTFCLSPTEPATAEKRTLSGDEYVTRYLAQHPNASLDDITDNADVCSPEAARKAIYRLAREGKIRRTNSGGRGIKACYAIESRNPTQEIS